MGEMGSENQAKGPNLVKSYFDVLGLCCSSEVPLIEKILKPLKGIDKVTVVVPSKTVIVVHDSNMISQLQIVKALNQAKLEASIRAYGTTKVVKAWPSPYIIACGVLLLVSLFKHFFHPLQWLAVAAAVVGLPPILFRSFAALRRFTLDINILMVIAVAGAVALKDYQEAGFIVFLFAIAEWLNSRASHKATAGMSTLMSMAPQKAVLAETGKVVDAQNVTVGTILAVKAGELVPIDGVVVEGKSEVNESSLTGESFPVAKQPDSLVWAGTLNVDGYISVKTTALAEDSTVAKMARLVEEAQNKRSNTQRLIDSFAKYYTPAVVVLAGGVVVIPLLLKAHNPRHWFQLALVLLVSACPCALVLSTPVATFCALLTAARLGLLVKGGDVLEALAKTKVVAFDKTGTITMGEFTVMDFRSISANVALDKLLYWVSSIESKSSHPLASTLVDYARMKSINPKPDNVTEFQMYPGEGIYGEMDGEAIYVGNKRLAARAGCMTVPNVEDMKDAVTFGYVFLSGVPIGIFTLADTCRTGSAEAIKDLKSLGVKTAMLTGDSFLAAMHAQNQLGNAIEMIHAELLPEDKVRIVSDLKSKVGPTIMVGDGLNDAPALAMANVGISMGISGSAVAMETSHITLMSNDIQKIPKAIRLAKRTHRKIIVNMVFSMTTKLAILALAIAGHPYLWAAVLADVGTCLIVILNSMTLLQSRIEKDDKCSHHSHGQCCGSSHESHEHNHGHSCHGHGHGAEEGGALHGHSCNDHETDHKCSSTGKKEDSRVGLLNHSHCGSSHKGHKHCSGSSHKTHAHKPACGEHCASGMHGHSTHEHGDGCHLDHETADEHNVHHNCARKCKEDSRKHSAATSTPQEHLISISGEVEHHSFHGHGHDHHDHAPCQGHLGNDHVHGHNHNHDHAHCQGHHGHDLAHGYSHHGHGHDHKKPHEHLISISDELEHHSHHGHGHDHDHGHDHHDHDHHGHNHSHDHHDHDHSHDHGHSERECGEKDGCSSSKECMHKREIGGIGGCSMTHKQEYGRQDSCCGGGTVQLPEIIFD